MKAAAPQALLHQNVSKSTKKSAKTTLASGRAFAPGKAGKFHGLLSTLAATKSGKPAAVFDLETVKKGLATALKTAKPPDPAVMAKTLKEPAANLKEALAVEKHEKQGPRKKAEVTQTSLAAVMPPINAMAASKRSPEQPTGPARKESVENPTQQLVTVAHRAAKPAEPVVHIVDLRRKQAPAKTEEPAAQGKPAAQNVADRDLSGAFVQKMARAAELQQPEAAPRATSSPMAHAQTPVERLKEMAGSELLKASNIILRDGGGEFKLVLKPESLGSIRVRMNLVDNAIEGRIIVDNAAVRHVVEANIDALKNALAQQGFQTGALSVSVGGQGTDTGHREQERPAEVRRIAAQGFERSMPAADDAGMSDLLVNLFV